MQKEPSNGQFLRCGRKPACDILKHIPVRGTYEGSDRWMEGVFMPKQLKKNDRIPLAITGVTAEGSGVGHDKGLAVFVALSLIHI